MPLVISACAAYLVVVVVANVTSPRIVFRRRKSNHINKHIYMHQLTTRAQGEPPHASQDDSSSGYMVSSSSDRCTCSVIGNRRLATAAGARACEPNLLSSQSSVKRQTRRGGGNISRPLLLSLLLSNGHRYSQRPGRVPVHGLPADVRRAPCFTCAATCPILPTKYS